MKVYPIIHTREGAIHTAINEANQAFEVGTDGVYITDHFDGARNKKPLFETYNGVVLSNPDRYVGINMFGAGPYRAVRALALALGKPGATYCRLLPCGQTTCGMTGSKNYPQLNSKTQNQSLARSDCLVVWLIVILADTPKILRWLHMKLSGLKIRSMWL